MMSVKSVKSLRPLVAGIGVATALSLGGAGSALAAAPPLSVAIVVGSNQSPTSNLENLRYGDDDAVQNARTFQLLGAQTTLLVSPDAETRELFPAAHPDAPATRAALRKAFDDAKAALAAAHAAGRKTELYFLFAGHGDMTDGRPFLQVDDGRLYREDLAGLLRTAGADENHVLVDACYAASFVSDRGPGGARENLPPGFSNTQVSWPARTGFLTARSSGGQTHEWAEYQSGVFSHELRSGLMGAADVSVDSKVTYREIRGLRAAAPTRPSRTAATAPRSRPSLRAAISTPRWPRCRRGPWSSRWTSRRAAGRSSRPRREFASSTCTRGAGAPIQLRLPIDQGGLFVEQFEAPGSSASREFRVAPRSGHILLSSLTPEASQVRARGADATRPSCTCSRGRSTSRP